MISKRTKDALAAAKPRGTKLGGNRGVVPSKKMRAMGVQALQARADAKAADLAPIIEEATATGKTSLRAIASGLNDAGIPTARGGKWPPPQVMRMLDASIPFAKKKRGGVSV